MLAEKRRRRKSPAAAIKPIARGYKRSGDIYGKKGLRFIEERSRYMNQYTDKEQLAKDWLEIGADMEASIKKYEESLRR